MVLIVSIGKKKTVFEIKLKTLEIVNHGEFTTTKAFLVISVDIYETLLM